MKRKEISAIIPTYNRAAFLGKAIESVLEQTRVPKELIVVDDGSTDDTDKIVKGYQAVSEVPIILIKQTNMGPAAARNKGIKLASAELIAFLDSDDHWLKKKLQLQAAEMERYPKYKISHTMEKWFRRGNHLNQKKKHYPPHGDIFVNCLDLCCVGMSTVMLESSIFSRYGLFDEGLPCCEDYDYWLRLAVHEEFMLVEKRLTIKEGGREDQVSFIYKTGIDRFRIMSIISLLKKEKLNEEQKHMAQKALKTKCRIYGQGCIKHGKPEEGNYILGLIDSNTEYDKYYEKK